MVSIEMPGFTRIKLRVFSLAFSTASRVEISAAGPNSKSTQSPFCSQRSAGGGVPAAVQAEKIRSMPRPHVSTARSETTARRKVMSDETDGAAGHADGEPEAE
jgi:hypothetical protein